MTSKPPFFSRRGLLTAGVGSLAGSSGILRGGAVAAPQHNQSADAKPSPPGRPGRDYRPVVTPNGATLPFKVVDGVKVFHLIAEPVKHEFAPGLVGDCWGYNGRTPGPTIEAVEGDRVRIYVTNKLPEPTTVHWHGVLVPNAMDGVAGLSPSGLARRSGTSSRCASTGRRCTTRTSTR